jgi:hypothetical protein
VVAETGAVVCVPLAASGPVHPPEAVHAVALVELQVRVDVPPAATTVGLADRVATGTVVTFTGATAAALVPPAPVQVSEKEASAVSAPEVWLPLAASAPLQLPEAVHEVALVELQVSVVVLPLLTVVGSALSVAVGTTLTVTDAAGLVPPVPVHVNVKVCADVIAPVL